MDRFCPAELTSLASTTKNVQVNITSFTVNNNLVSAPQPVCTSQVSGLGADKCFRLLSCL